MVMLELTDVDSDVLEVSMRTKLAVLLAGAGLVCASPILAHHAVTAEYDANKPVKVMGTVTKIEWTNPHSRIYVDVKQPDGTFVNWNLELAARSALVRQGWTASSLKIGDEVTVEGIGARTNVAGANARSVTLADGRKVFSGASD
jgi:hypothetical protein